MDRDNLIEDDIDDEVTERNELEGCGGTICCNPYRNVYRFVALFFMCFLNFGSYYCYDNPAALEDNIISDMKISSTQYGFLYSFYSWPNVIFPFFGGFLIDRLFGIRLGAIIFSAFIMAGQSVFASGALVNSFALMVVGRLIFAVGGENLLVCQNNYAVKWFKGKELNTVFGIQLSFARLGSTVNLYAMKPLYDAMTESFGISGYKALGSALMIGGTSTIVSFGCAFILMQLDRRNDYYLAVNTENNESNDESDIRLKDVLQFPLTFWIICAICVTYYAAIFPFVGFGLMFFETKFGLSPYPWSEVCNSLMYFISIVASPVSGALVDYFGRNCFWVIIACALTIIGHSMLAFTFWSPYIAVVLMGIAYSILAAALWPLVAFVISEERLGTAYGVMQSIQNLGLAILFITAGTVLDSKGYLMLELYFLSWLSVALACSIVLWFADKSKTGILNMNSAQRKENLENEEKRKNV